MQGAETAGKILQGCAEKGRKIFKYIRYEDLFKSNKRLNKHCLIKGCVLSKR